MGLLPNQFDANKVDPNSFEPLPTGWYTAAAIRSEVKPTKDGTGTRAVFTYKILDGSFKDREITDGLNIQNKNPKAQEIALGQLSSFCRAVNVMTPRDTNELCNKAMKIRVKLQPAQNGYDESNSVTSFKSLLAASQGSDGQAGPAVGPTSPQFWQPSSAPPVAAPPPKLESIDNPYDQAVQPTMAPNPADEVRKESLW
jgi:hypothetical protein